MALALSVTERAFALARFAMAAASRASPHVPWWTIAWISSLGPSSSPISKASTRCQPSTRSRTEPSGPPSLDPSPSLELGMDLTLYRVTGGSLSSEFA